MSEPKDIAEMLERLARRIRRTETVGEADAKACDEAVRRLRAQEGERVRIWISRTTFGPHDPMAEERLAQLLGSEVRRADLIFPPERTPDE